MLHPHLATSVRHKTQSVTAADAGDRSSPRSGHVAQSGSFLCLEPASYFPALLGDVQSEGGSFSVQTVQKQTQWGKTHQRASQDRDVQLWHHSWMQLTAKEKKKIYEKPSFHVRGEQRAAAKNGKLS